MGDPYDDATTANPTRNDQAWIAMNPLRPAAYDFLPREEPRPELSANQDVKEGQDDDVAEDWVDASIEASGYGWYQQRLMVLSAALWMSDSMEVSLLSFLYECVGASMHLSPVKAASIVSVVFAGELLGAAVAGPLGDAYGRKPASIVAALLVAFAGLATAFAQNLSTFIVFRGLVGVGVGALAVPFDLMAEFLPTSTRGEKLTIIEFAWASGALYATAASYLFRRYSWRAMVLACALPFILVFAGVIAYLDESPRWLAANGRQAQAQAVLAKVAKVNGAKFQDPPAIGEQALGRHTLLDGINDMKRQLSRLAAPDLRTKTALVWIVWLGFGLDFYGISLLVTRLFGKNQSGSGSDFECHFRYKYIIITTTAQFVGTLILLLMIDKLGRVKSQSLPYMVTALALLPIALLPKKHGLAHLSCLYIALAAQMMASSAAWVHVPELYPTDVRSSAHSLALTVSRLSAFSASYLVDSTLDLPLVLLVLAITAGASALAASRLPETRGGVLN